VYAWAWIRLVIYRLLAAVTAILAITLIAFAGAVVGAMGYPRWPAVKMFTDKAISGAIVTAATEVGRWSPAVFLLGLILVLTLRPQRWLFGLTMLSGGVLGYFQDRIPSPLNVVVASAMGARATSLVGRLHLRASLIPPPVAAITLVAAALIGWGLHRRAYAGAVRTTGFIPARPASHYRSLFRAVSVARRLAATLVTTAFLAVSLWLVDHIAALSPHAHYGTFLLGHSHLSLTELVIAIVALALAICAPRPQGYQWLLVFCVIAITVCAFLPYQILPPMPPGVPAAPDNLWALAALYLLVTGLAFDLIAALLDWQRLV
jgi:hypothetical protein